jgi:hypothetical protein
MPLQVIPAPLAEEAKALQREFAAASLRVRGYVNESGARGGMNFAAEAPPRLAQREILQGSGQVAVEAVFREPPIAAYIDGRYPLRINVSRGEVVNDNGSMGYQVTLSAPPGTDGRFGPVTLVWPDRSVVCAEPLSIRRSSVIQHWEQFEVQTQPRGLLLTGIHERPVELHVAGNELRPDKWQWDMRSGRLLISIEEHISSGTLLVVTTGSVMQCNFFFQEAG